jgi:hypothetical protein
MGIHPHIFGPYIWASIHLICLGAPKDMTANALEKYKRFFNLLPSVLPCQNCANHLSKNLKKLPLDNSINSASALFDWSVQLHNIVNKQLNKKQLSEDDALTFWSSAPQCSISTTTGQTSYSSNNGIIFYYLIVLVIGIIIGYFLKFLCTISIPNFKK